MHASEGAPIAPLFTAGASYDNKKQEDGLPRIRNPAELLKNSSRLPTRLSVP